MLLFCLRFSLIFLLCALMGCSSTVEEQIPCATISDCPLQFPVCAGGVCTKGCDQDSDCPVIEGAQWKCLSDGTCAMLECINDSDCCTAGDASCALICAGGICTGNVCETGKEQTCYDDCHTGKEYCINGFWTECDAAPNQIEVCGDGIDNDCKNGVDDGCPACEPGVIQPCSTPCDTGEQTCGSDSQWGPCSASDDCTCAQGETKVELCGDCGYADVNCGVGGTWNDIGLCLNEGECAPEGVEDVACGKCGVQSRLCSVECTWGEFTTCANEGECEPGESVDVSCTPTSGTGCGSLVRTCSDTCQWEDGACVAGAGCAEGQTQSVSCGSKCGEEISVCDAQCNWVSSGICQDEGVCVLGMVDKETCGLCGEQTRVCTNECTWGDWGVCEGGGVCEPGANDSQFCGPVPALGECTTGTQARNCKNNCQWDVWDDCVGATYPSDDICGNGKDEDCDGQDYVVLDAYEDNNSCTSCFWLGEDPNEKIFPTTHSPYDVDYFCFQASDGTTVFGSETIYVKLSNQTGGMDNDLYLYQGYSACEQGSAIASSVVIGNGDETLTWTETNSPDDGIYVIEVEPYGDGSCLIPYELEINGLN